MKKEQNQNSDTKFHYYTRQYDVKERFCSYWHQIDEVLSLNEKRILEIGVGNGFVSRYLSQKGLNLFTLDIIQALGPDVAGSVLSIPFATASFPVVTCCEVLEHLPYTDFQRALKEIHRVSQKHAILSLPDHTPTYKVHIELPRLKTIKKLIPHPFPRTSRHEFDGQHHWIIGRKNYPLRKIVSDIERMEFKICKTYRVFEFYGHRFFLLERL